MWMTSCCQPRRCKYRTHLHGLIYLAPAIFGLVGALIALGLFAQGTIGGGILTLLIAAAPVTGAYITRKTSEFAVTDRRVIIKVGWIRRRTLETMLGKVEGIGVDQGIAGRMF